MGHLYAEAKDAFCDAIERSNPDAAVPACPEWTVHELLAHQLHQLKGARDGTFPLADALVRVSARAPVDRSAAATRQDAWIAAGVQKWSRMPVPELVEAWDSLAEDSPAATLDALAPDVVVHLFDLLGAIGDRADRTHPMVTAALQFWADQAGVPVPEDRSSHFELLRAITGRRSREQAPDLDDDAALYGWRPTRLDE